MKKTIYISKDLHTEFKLICNKKYISMYAIANRIIKDWLEKIKIEEIDKEKELYDTY